jgi:predicted transposase/invertase (TIGR01784 family)
LVLTQFVKDVIGIDIVVKKIETEKRFKPKMAYIDFSYDIFAETKDNRVIVEIQRVKYDYHFDRFLHYHNMAIAELQRKASDYKIKRKVYTIVVLTAPSLITDEEGKSVEDDVYISDVNPRNRQDKVVKFYGHQLIFLNPNFKTDDTPSALKDWFDLILESIKNPENPKINFQNKAIKRAAELIEDDNFTPELRQAAKIAVATEETRKIVEKQAKEEEKMEIAQNMIAKGFDVETISEITGLSPDTIEQLGTE